jgi:predicted metal-dependent hydrolase
MPPLTYPITIDGISVMVVHKPVKNLNLRISARNGQVTLSAPHSVGTEVLISFLTAKLDWIRAKKSSMNQSSVAIQPRLISGDRVFYLGQSYRLQVVEQGASRENVALPKADEIYLFCRPGTPEAKRGEILNRWYRQSLRSLFPELLAKWEPVIGVNIRECRIKRMRTRWGSCNIKDRRIWLNLALAERPLSCLEYVLVHEMIHLLERRHNGRFYALLDHFLPHWQKARDQLKQQLTGSFIG